MFNKKINDNTIQNYEIISNLQKNEWKILPLTALPVSRLEPLLPDSLDAVAEVIDNVTAR